MPSFHSWLGVAARARELRPVRLPAPVERHAAIVRQWRAISALTMKNLT